MSVGVPACWLRLWLPEALLDREMLKSVPLVIEGDVDDAFNGSEGASRVDASGGRRLRRLRNGGPRLCGGGTFGSGSSKVTGTQHSRRTPGQVPGWEDRWRRQVREDGETTRNFSRGELCLAAAPSKSSSCWVWLAPASTRVR